jgi:hypothetical protein
MKQESYPGLEVLLASLMIASPNFIFYLPITIAGKIMSLIVFYDWLIIYALVKKIRNMGVC